MSNLKVITRQDCMDQLPEGSDPLVVEIHLRVTAAARHESRIAAALAAVCAAYPAASPDQLTAILALEGEHGGSGGRRGYNADTQAGIASTARMRWARGLGKGRRQASDGGAWTAAVEGAGMALGVSRPASPWNREAPAWMASAASLITGDDLEWPLAYALRAVESSVAQSAFAVAADWANVARDIATRCEPDGDAGQLAIRYGMTTLPRRYAGSAHLRDDICAALLGMTEAEIAVQPAGIIMAAADFVSVTLLIRCRVRRLDETEYDGGMPHAIEDGWLVQIDTKAPAVVIKMIRRAWKWCEGAADRDGLTILLESMMPDPTTATEMRKLWETEQETEDVSSTRVVTLSSIVHGDYESADGVE
jgi:hypothetical protein